MRGTSSLIRRGGSLRELADEDLMMRAAAGDQRAFGVIFDRHGSAAFSLAYRMCGQRAVAEDIVQESFLSLWRSGERYDGRRGSLRTFILGVVRNRAVDSFRSRNVRELRDIHDDGIAEALPAADATDVEAGRRDDARQIRDALQELPVEQRRVIELAYFGGYSHQEIATMLELPAGTVKGRMRLGLSKLRLSLDGLAEVVI